MILKDNDFILRHWRDLDAKDLYDLAKNPKIGPIAGWPPHSSVDDSLNVIKTIFTRPECYAITKGGSIVGSIELLVHPNCNHWWGEGSAELGYWIGEPHQSKGYATRASEMLIKRAFEDLNIERIFATYKKENAASGRVLEKLGFEHYCELNNLDYLNIPYVEIAVLLEK